MGADFYDNRNGYFIDPQDAKGNQFSGEFIAHRLRACLLAKGISRDEAPEVAVVYVWSVERGDILTDCDYVAAYHAKDGEAR